MTHYYVYYRSGRDVMFDRSYEKQGYADERVAELRTRGCEAWWVTDVLKCAFI